MQNKYHNILAKLQARNLAVTSKCVARRTKQAHTPAQAKAKCVSLIEANIRHLRNQDANVAHIPLYAQKPNGNFQVAAKYGNSYLQHWLPVVQEDGSMELDTYLESTEEGLVTALETLKELIEEGYADEAIEKVQKQNAEAGRKRMEAQQAKKRVKVQG